MAEFDTDDIQRAIDEADRIGERLKESLAQLRASPRKERSAPAIAAPDAPSPPPLSKDEMEAQARGLVERHRAASRPPAVAPAPSPPSTAAHLGAFGAPERALGRLDQFVRLAAHPPFDRVVPRWRAVMARVEAAEATSLLGEETMPERIAATMAKLRNAHDAGDRIGADMARLFGVVMAPGGRLVPSAATLHVLLRHATSESSGLRRARRWTAEGWDPVRGRAAALALAAQPALGGLPAVGRMLREVIAMEAFGGRSLAMAVALAGILVRRHCDAALALPFCASGLRLRIGGFEGAYARGGAEWDAYWAGACRAGLERALSALDATLRHSAVLEDAAVGKRERVSRVALVDALYEEPVTTSLRLAKRLNVSKSGAEHALDRLKEAGLAEPLRRGRSLDLWRIPAALDTV